MKNWLSAVQLGELDVGKTQFEIHLGRKRKGFICELFSSATTEKLAKAAIATAKSRVVPKRKPKVGTECELNQILNEVFAPANEKAFCGIVSRFELTFGEGHAYGELLELMKQ